MKKTVKKRKNKLSKTQLILFPITGLLFPILVYLIETLDAMFGRPTMSVLIAKALFFFSLILYIILSMVWIIEVKIFIKNIRDKKNK